MPEEYSTIDCPECGNPIEASKRTIKKHIIRHWGIDIDEPWTHKNKDVVYRVNLLISAISDVTPPEPGEVE